jgi:hypothetical protein
LSLTPAPDEVMLDGLQSRTVLQADGSGVPTRYRHLIGRAEWVEGTPVSSSQPLHWATADEVSQGQTAGVRPVAGSKPGKPGPISPTVFRLAQALQLLDADAAADDDIRNFLQHMAATAGTW